MSKRKTYGQFLKGYREKAELSEQQFAEKVGKTADPEYPYIWDACNIEGFEFDDYIPNQHEHDSMIAVLKEYKVRINEKLFNSVRLRNLPLEHYIKEAPCVQELVEFLRDEEIELTPVTLALFKDWITGK